MLFLRALDSFWQSFCFAALLAFFPDGVYAEGLNPQI